VATVLVVDDRRVNRDLVRTVLGYHGHATLEAGGGHEALTVLEHDRPDVVLVDLVMPDMNGYELACAIRSDPHTMAIPVVFYTANYLAAETSTAATNEPVTRIVEKTGDLTALVEAINDAVAPPDIVEAFGAG
jgi:CheY-like chemotaxis protein